MTTAIRSTYFIFCCRNKDWENPELYKYLIVYIHMYFYISMCMYSVFVILMSIFVIQVANCKLP